MHLFIFQLALITAGLNSSVAIAQNTSRAEHSDASELSSGIAHATEGLAVLTVFEDPMARTVHVRRDTSGEVELHAFINDVMFAHKGSVTVVLGGRIEGGKETAAGEIRGGRIIGGRSQTFKAGEMMWIPAGEPHQMILKKGRSFTYSVVKTLK